MIFHEEREDIVSYGKKLVSSGLTKSTGGNLSVFFREKKLMAITPSGIDYFQLKAEDIVIMDLQGHVVDGVEKPSSEYELHRIFYEKRRDINAVVHAHSVYSTSLSSLNWELPAVHYLLAVAGGKNVRCADYATFGTKELAENVYKAMEGRFAVFLANHGLLTGGKDLSDAFSKAEEIEFCAEIYYRTRLIGDPVILPDEEMENMVKLFQDYGQKKEG